MIKRNFKSGFILLFLFAALLGIAGRSSAAAAASHSALVSNKTWSQMDALATAGKFTPGQKYEIIDFRTRNKLPNTDDGEGNPLYNTGAAEPLIVSAVSATQIDARAESTTYPKDEILYELVDSSLNGGDRGRILYRRDPILQRSAFIDWRNVKLRRWNTQADGLGAWTSLTDNGNPSQDFYIFGNGLYDPANDGYIEIARYINPTDIEIGNNVFLGRVAAFSAMGQFHDNTFGENVFINNSHMATFTGNTIGDNFQHNIIPVNSFINNGVGNSCYSNTFGAYVESCSLGDNFQENFILGEFLNNTCADDFKLNHIGIMFARNVTAAEFSWNIVGHNFTDITFPAVVYTGKTLIDGYSNFNVAVDITGLTTLDITENNSKFAGIVNVTSTNAAESIDTILNQPSRFDYEIRPASGLTLTVTGTAVASLSADGKIIMGAASRVLVGANGDYIRLRKATVGGYTVAKEVEVNISN